MSEALNWVGQKVHSYFSKHCIKKTKWTFWPTQYLWLVWQVISDHSLLMSTVSRIWISSGYLLIITPCGRSILIFLSGITLPVLSVDMSQVILHCFRGRSDSGLANESIYYSWPQWLVLVQGDSNLGVVLRSESHSVVSDSLQPQGLYSPWNSPGQNTGVGSLSLLQEKERERQTICVEKETDYLLLNLNLTRCRPGAPAYFLAGASNARIKAMWRGAEW